MAQKKVLLLYISEYSGHYCASRAIEMALHHKEPGIETLNINSFNYTNPILEKVINRAYMGVVRRTPEIWDYLYDNPKVLKNTQRLRAMIHKFNTSKLKFLLDDFKPDAIVCTQAFPCGMIADYKKSFNINIPLIGVLTDYAPHSYWVYDSVDRYIVPSECTGSKLVNDGIDPAKIMPFGIPIDQKFQNTLNKDRIFEKIGFDKNLPCVLLMGGSQGLGPIKELVKFIDRSDLRMQLIIATGTNKKMYNWLERHKKSFRKKILILGYADNIDELMEVSTIVITKPGGITTAEALAKGLPMLIVSPLPGQEAMNTKYLLEKGVAVKAANPEDVVVLMTELLYNKDKLKIMSEKARYLSRPASAVNISDMILGIVKS